MTGVVRPARDAALVREFYARLWNRWEYPLAERLLSADLRFHGSIGLTVRGRSGFVEYAETIRAAFPDFHNTVEELIAADGRVAARLTYRGTHRGPLLGRPATGRRVQYAGAAFFHLAAGRIEAVWVLGDLHGLLAQIDAPPA